jgi:hypothetical protein
MSILYEKRKLIGAIQQFEFYQGGEEVIDVPTFGGMHYVQY